MARPRLLAVVLGLGSFACDSAPAAVPRPPPPPPFPALSPTPPPAQEAAPSANEATPVAPAHAAKSEGAPKHAPAHEATKQAHEPAPKPAAQPKPAASAKPVAAAPAQAPAKAPIVAPTPKPEVASKVSVPKTVHLQLDVPAGLQADLDHDPRMQPWVNQVVATIDRCYASESKSNTKLEGTIQVLVTMHENERPDADIKALPPALSPIVACATGGLMRTKMPLFTGKENTRYTVRLKFTP